MRGAFGAAFGASGATHLALVDSKASLALVEFKTGTVEGVQRRAFACEGCDIKALLEAVTAVSVELEGGC